MAYTTVYFFVILLTAKRFRFLTVLSKLNILYTILYPVEENYKEPHLIKAFAHLLFSTNILQTRNTNILYIKSMLMSKLYFYIIINNFPRISSTLYLLSSQFTLFT